ncbi:MAG: tRNA (adenine(22)-N(1))-methyltransferase TrmK [Candidatus Dormibacteria bacterium]
MTTWLLAPSGRASHRPRWSPGAGIGRRLGALLELCPDDGPVADVGSGHGRLALALKRRNPRRRVLATELRSGPAAELRRLLGPDTGIPVLEGDGLSPLAGWACRGVVIAGIGGNGIRAILEREPVLARGLDWLCLQPAQRPEPLRVWLAAQGWDVTVQRLVGERRHCYPTLLVHPR